jgi:hypothetical protein
MSNPKLALIPSGYKSGKVYSILPNDATGDFDFDRASEGTRVRKDGLIEEVTSDVPRLDWLNSNCPSLLLEPQRTNGFTYSEQFEQGVWFKSNCTITTNQIIAPDGTLTADLATSTANGGGVYRFNSWNTTEKTVSIFVKINTSNTAEIFNGSAGTNRVVFDLVNGTVDTEGGSMTGTIKDFGNGWYRLTATHTAVTGQTFGLKPETNESLYIWGAQIEDGGYSSTYIKTEASTLTRLYEDFESENTYSTGNDVTWFLDFNTYSFQNSFRPLFVARNSGFTQTMDLITYNSGSDYYFRIRATNQSSFQTIIAFGQNAIQMFTRNKVAVRLYGSNFEIYVNGTREYTGTSTDGDWTLLNNSAILNDFGSNTERPSARLYDFRVYDQTMTQTELEKLTIL